MTSRKLVSVGDLAHRHGVHESEVIDWASDNNVPKLGREFAFSDSDAKKFAKWIETQLEEAGGDDDLDEDEDEDEDGEGENEDDEDDEDGESEDEDDD